MQLPPGMDANAFVKWLRTESEYLHTTAGYADEMGYVVRARTMAEQAQVYESVADVVEAETGTH